MLAFSTKAGTLSQLQGTLRSARIAPQVFFTVGKWLADHSECLDRIRRGLKDEPWIVRSSCSREDSAEASNAGAFLSRLNVWPWELQKAIEDVIESFGEAQPSDEVLVQPMLKNVVRSGVAFSHDPQTSAPYRVVNWAEGGDTTAVTSGIGGRTWLQAANSVFCATM